MDTNTNLNPRPLVEIIERARAVANDRYVRRLVDGGMKPYPVSLLVRENSQGDRRTKEFRAMSARWLAILKRDYPDEYEKLIHESQDATQP